MTTREIIIEHLQSAGFDGLAGEDCGCGLDDLMPCGESFADCVPAHRWVCSPTCPMVSGHEAYCEFEGEGGCWRAVVQP